MVNRKTHSSSHSSGFTIIELLIVITVIGILVGIVVVSYNGITQRARQTTLTADLVQNSDNLADARSKTGLYPATQALAGLEDSHGVTLTYNVAPNFKSYCLQSSGWGMSYVITQDNTNPRKGVCSGTSATS